MSHEKGKRPRANTIDDRYRPREEAGGGTWGVVYLAVDKETKEGVAVKKLRLRTTDKDMERMARREMFILRACQGPYVVRLLETFEGCAGPTGEGTVFLVMEQMRHDLRGLLDHKEISSRWTRSHVKGYAWQILNAVAYCHERGYMHRDLKPANVLVDDRNTLKLADFGLASAIKKHPDKEGQEIANYGRYTNNVCTLWYRAPELLYGSRAYDARIDVWSVGCIFGELLQNSLLMPGESEDDQLKCIYALCGTPLENGWPEAAALPKWLPPAQPVLRDFPRLLIAENKLVARKAFFSRQAVSLLDSLLTLKPEARPTAAAALGHPYFDAESDGGVAIMQARDMVRYNDKNYFAKKK